MALTMSYHDLMFNEIWFYFKVWLEKFTELETSHSQKEKEINKKVKRIKNGDW